MLARLVRSCWKQVCPPSKCTVLYISTTYVQDTDQPARAATEKDWPGHNIAIAHMQSICFAPHTAFRPVARCLQLKTGLLCTGAAAAAVLHRGIPHCGPAHAAGGATTAGCAQGRLSASEGQHRVLHSQQSGQQLQGRCSSERRQRPAASGPRKRQQRWERCFPNSRQRPAAAWPRAQQHWECCARKGRQRRAAAWPPAQQRQDCRFAKGRQRRDTAGPRSWHAFEISGHVEQPPKAAVPSALRRASSGRQSLVLWQGISGSGVALH